jgi:hypothetical protein
LGAKDPWRPIFDSFSDPIRYICPALLTEKEKQFMEYWQQQRSRQKKLLYQLAVGLPFGLLLGAVILSNFFSGWYKRAEMIANSQFNPVVLYVAVLIIAVFVAIFSKKFQWDQQEQRYLELKHKLGKSTSPEPENSGEAKQAPEPTIEKKETE